MEQKLLNILNRKDVKPFLQKHLFRSYAKTVAEQFQRYPSYVPWVLKWLDHMCCVENQSKLPVKYVTQIHDLSTLVNTHHEVLQILPIENIVSITNPNDISNMLEAIPYYLKYNFITKIGKIFPRNLQHIFRGDGFNIEKHYIDECFLYGGQFDSDKLDADFDIIEKFNQLPQKTIKNVIKLCTPLTDSEEIVSLISQSIAPSYKWSVDGVCEFIEKCLIDTPIKKIDNGVILAEVKNFEDIRKLCGYGRTAWCITRSKQSFNDYVDCDSVKQFVLLDTNLPQDDDLAYVGLTVNLYYKDITNCHIRNNEEVLYGLNDNKSYLEILESKRINIYDVLDIKRPDVLCFANKPVFSNERFKVYLINPEKDNELLSQLCNAEVVKLFTKKNVNNYAVIFNDQNKEMCGFQTNYDYSFIGTFNIVAAMRTYRWLTQNQLQMPINEVLASQNISNEAKLYNILLENPTAQILQDYLSKCDLRANIFEQPLWQSFFMANKGQYMVEAIKEGKLSSAEEDNWGFTIVDHIIFDLEDSDKYMEELSTLPNFDSTNSRLFKLIKENTNNTNGRK